MHINIFRYFFLLMINCFMLFFCYLVSPTIRHDLLGRKSCKDDNKKCATYCNGDPECADGLDELDRDKYNDKLSLSKKSISKYP